MRERTHIKYWPNRRDDIIRIGERRSGEYEWTPRGKTNRSGKTGDSGLRCRCVEKTSEHVWFHESDRWGRAGSRRREGVRRSRHTEGMQSRD